MKPRKNCNISCGNCRVGHLCLAKNLSDKSIQQLDNNIHYIKLFEPGEHLYLQGNTLKHIYALQSGICKDYSIDKEGNEYINEFYLPGDILALEFLNKNIYELNAIAIKKTIACVIPVNFIKNCAVPGLKDRFFEILCQKINNYCYYASQANVKSRIIVFLLNHIRRLKERMNESIAEDSIPMQLSFIDISNKIGISNETFSRILKDLTEKNLVIIKNHTIINIDIERLNNLLLTDNL